MANSRNSKNLRKGCYITHAAHPFFKAGRIKTAISCLRDGRLHLALKRIEGTLEPVGVLSNLPALELFAIFQKIHYTEPRLS